MDESLHSGGYSFETQKNISDEDEEMAAFEAECARMLEQEHERRAKEEKDEEIAKAAEAIRAIAMPESKSEPEPEPEPTSEPTSEPESEPISESTSEPESEPISESTSEPESEPTSEPPPVSEPEPQKQSLHDELAAIMQAESNESIMHSAAAQIKTDEAVVNTETDTETGEPDEGDSGNVSESIPGWLRILFSILLLMLGGMGLYVMVGMEYRSAVFDPLCFMEITVCMLTAVGLNSSQIQFRVGKEMIMRLAAYALFAFYVIYSADCLFLRRLLADGIDKDSILPYAKTHLHFDIAGGLDAMGNSGMLGCALFVLPIAFMLLLLFKPLRNIILYVFTIVFLFLGVSALRIVTMSGPLDLSQGCMAMAGAAGAYIIFVFPPLRKLMTEAGLILWEYYDDDEDDD